MTKHILFPIFLVLAFIAIVGLIIKKSPEKTGSFLNSPTTQALWEITLGQTKLKVFLADTPRQREVGLSEKESLSESEGMLFVFDKKPTQPVFWMKGMKFAIDIIWIADDMILAIDKNVPPPQEGTGDNLLIKYSPPGPIDYVLETNAGFADKNNLKVKDRVDLSGLKLP